MITVSFITAAMVVASVFTAGFIFGVLYMARGSDS